MKPGLVPGHQAEVTVTVTDEMVAWFEELGGVHRVYSTWAMVRHLELASRKVILPFLEADEDAVGHSISVTHVAPTRVGATVTTRATLLRIEGPRIVCALEARNEREVIGTGENVQVVLSRARLAERFGAL